MATLGSLTASLVLQSAAITRGLAEANSAMRSQTYVMRQHAAQLQRGFGQVEPILVCSEFLDRRRLAPADLPRTLGCGSAWRPDVEASRPAVRRS